MHSGGLFVAFAFIAATPVAVSAQTAFRVEAKAGAPADGELAALRLEYAAAASAGDATRLSGLYANDAIAVPREGVMLRGRAEIQRYSDEAFASVRNGAIVTLTPQQFATQGSMASETGTFAETPAGEGEPGATGVYVTIYTRDAEGAWRIAMDVRTRGRDKPVVSW